MILQHIKSNLNQYYLGDPLYIFSDEDWEEICYEYLNKGISENTNFIKFYSKSLNKEVEFLLVKSSNKGHFEHDDVKGELKVYGKYRNGKLLTLDDSNAIAIVKVEDIYLSSVESVKNSDFSQIVETQSPVSIFKTQNEKEAFIVVEDKNGGKLCLKEHKGNNKPI